MKFAYRGIDQYGKLIEGVIEANSIAEAEEKLTIQGLKNIKLKALVKPKRDITKGGLFQPKVKEKDLAIFTRQLGALISAGVGISEALEILSEQIPHKTLSAALKEVKDDVAAGQSLSVALSKHKGVFPEFLVNLIAAAEESGNLDIILQRASLYYEKIHAYRFWNTDIYRSHICRTVQRLWKRASFFNTGNCKYKLIYKIKYTLYSTNLYRYHCTQLIHLQNRNRKKNIPQDVSQSSTIRRSF